MKQNTKCQFLKLIGLDDDQVLFIEQHFDFVTGDGVTAYLQCVDLVQDMLNH